MCSNSVEMEGTIFLRSPDASDHSVPVVWGAFWPENGRPGGDLGSQAGRQVGLKLSFLNKNDQKIDKKLIEEGFHKKLGKMMEK